MMAGNCVCAVIVTYYPGPEVLENVASVRPQVDALVIVDNGSPESARALFRQASERLSFIFIENGANLGIAAALNIGARWAQANGYQWVALFDQDSTPTEGMIQSMLDEYQTHPDPGRVGLLTPKHINRKTGEWRAPALAGDGTPLTAITSGSLVPLSVFDCCGWFEEELIIDRVDDEFCLRLRSTGFTIALCPRAVLLHAVGNPRAHKSFIVGSFRASHHNAKRRYYITRNRLIMIRRYWRRYPRWCYAALVAMLKDTAKIVLVEEDSWEKLVNTFRGIAHACIGRMGKVVDL